MNDDELASGTDDTALLEELRNRLTLAEQATGENHAEALDDLRFAAGDHWPASVKRERELDGRPCLTINKLPTFIHQVTNDQRMNVPGIKVSAVNEADVKTAEVLQGLVRHIEYASNADVAYDTAVCSAATIGFGYFRLITRYCRPDSFDQEIAFQRIRNPFAVYGDPNSQEPDGSDSLWWIISEKVPRWQFKKDHPNAQAASAQTGDLPARPGDPSVKGWIWADYIRVVDYYRIEFENDTLVMLPDGSSAYRSELDKANVAVPPDSRTRPTQRKKVVWYKCTGLDVLERTEIMCEWIPVFPVYGDELDIDGRVIRSGIVRNAKDAQKMYDFWLTSATEEVALRPKTPWVGAEGQFEGFEDDWAEVNRRGKPFLEYKPVSLEGVLAPPPQRQPMADIPAGAMQMAMLASDNIKATTGLFDSSLGALGSARSGVQERQQQRQGDVANFHFTDNLNNTVRQAGRCLVSMIPHYYDGTRVVRIMGEDGTISGATINQPQQVQQQGDDGAMQTVQKVLNDLTVGEYDIVIKAGPSYDTLRQEAVESMVQVAGKWPKLMEVAGDKVIRAMDWPGADEIADRVERTIPPEVRGEEGAEDIVQTPQGPVPKAQVGPMMAQMQQQLQEMGQRLQDAESGVAVAQVRAQADLQKAQLQAQADLERERMSNESAERVAETNAVSRSDVEELKGYVALLVAQLTPPPALAAAAMTEGGQSLEPTQGEPA